MSVSGRSLKRNSKTGRTFLKTLLAISIIFFAGFVYASGGGEGAEPKGWVKTDTYRVMNFTVLAIGCIFLIRKFGTPFLNSRIEDIKIQLSDLESKKNDAEKQLNEYTKKLSDLEKEADKIIADYVKQGEDAKKRILSEAENAATKLEDQAKRNIEREFDSAKSELQEEIIAKALIKAEEIIKNKITSEDQDKLVDEYLDKVVA
ncbi:MAG: ATP synthase F0 subunit B [Desulfobacterales bacterium]|jgi:F-type H+-transporting ATPase subunit b|nr:ATP synthase F0 subunit B [Desulfobacteraceae bacterium]MBT7086762.1 ATP synthase F0 subunit B [Desulfobacterales bacterium]MBT7698081.1 ATP synthase F0 subunit B [Desulfobacterales bacterium]